METSELHASWVVAMEEDQSHFQSLQHLQTPATVSHNTSYIITSEWSRIIYPTLMYESTSPPGPTCILVSTSSATWWYPITLSSCTRLLSTSVYTMLRNLNNFSPPPPPPPSLHTVTQSVGYSLAVESVPWSACTQAQWCRPVS